MVHQLFCRFMANTIKQIQMRKPLITIAIPTYNRADKYLVQTLKRASRQTYSNIEILISDNCSTDKTEEIVRAYAKSDPRVTYFRQSRNLGQLGNTNFLLQKANGDYFHLFHDDDLIEEDFVETCIKSADYSTKYGIIMTGSRVVDDEGKTIRENENPYAGKSLDEVILEWYQGKGNIFLCSTLFNTNVLKRIGGFEKKYRRYDDIAANFKCSFEAGRLDITDVKASFRVHTGSVTNSTDVDIWIKDSYNLLDLACSVAKIRKDEINREGLKRSALNVYMYANDTDSRILRMKSFWKVYTSFGFKTLPPLKYLNKLVPLSGYILHPYQTMGYMKAFILNQFNSQKVSPG